jgi:alpha-1,6-mannosyltransferase
VTALRSRWSGFAASVLLAVVALLAGSYDRHDAAWVVGTVLWYPATALLVFAWWRLGRCDVPVGRLLVTGGLWALPLLVVPALGSHDVYAYACQGQLVDAGLDVYRVGPSALPCDWLSSVPELWRSTPTPYGPLWLVLEGLVSWVAGGSLAVAVVGLRVVGLVGLGLCAWAGGRLARVLGFEPARVVWLVALSPLVMVHVVSGAHNDALLAGLVLCGLAVPGWTRRPVLGVVLAGVAFGLAAAIKVTALAAAPFAVPLLLAAGPGGLLAADPVTLVEGKARRLAGLTALLAVVIGATYAVLALVTGYGLGFTHALGSTSDLVQWLSLPTGLGMAVGYVLRVAGAPGLFGTAVAVARDAGYVALAATLVGLWWWAVRRARDAAGVVAAAGLALLAVALLGPVFYAWYAIAGLAVLGVATGGRHRGVAVAAAGLIYLTLPDSLGLATKTKLPGAFLDVALVVWLVVRLRSRRAPAPRARP